IDRSLIYMREPEDLTPFAPKIIVNPLEGIHLADLAQAFHRVLRRSAHRNRVTKIHRDEISVNDRIKQVLELLEEHGGRLRFSKLLSEELDRDEMIVTFLAVLELIKMRKIACFQESLFDEIIISLREEG